jgi:hypothetical protein
MVAPFFILDAIRSASRFMTALVRRSYIFSGCGPLNGRLEELFENAG